MQRVRHLPPPIPSTLRSSQSSSGSGRRCHASSRRAASCGCLALWVSRAYQDGYKGNHRDPLVGLGTAPLDDPQFRAAMFEQLGEHRLEAAVTTDICGKNDSHAVRLDNEAIEAIKKARLHRKVATTVFFESNGGMTRAEASAPEIRLSVADPDLDIGHVETVLDALTEACYYLTVERNRYHFSFKENLNKRYADRRANIKDGTIGERVREEIESVFATNGGISPIFFPENSGKIPDKPVLTFVVLAPEQSAEDEKRTRAFIETAIREHGTTGRTYKSGLIFVVCGSPGPLFEDARRLLAWQEIEQELPTISVDDSQVTQLSRQHQEGQARSEGVRLAQLQHRCACSERTTRSASLISASLIPAPRRRSSSSF